MSEISLKSFNGQDKEPAVQESIWGMPRLLAATGLAALGSLNYGYSISCVNTTGPIFKQCPAGSPVSQCIPVTPFWWGLVASIVMVGALVASPLVSPMANRLGRRLTIALLNVPLLLGTALLTLAVNLPMLLAGRFLVGMAVGAVGIAVPMYLVEISPLVGRGIIGSAHQMCIVSGILIGELVGLAGGARPFWWRLMFGAVPAALGLVQLVAFLRFVPESPRHLLVQKKEIEAGKALRWLRGGCYHEAELEAMTKAVQQADLQEQPWTLKELLWLNFGQSKSSLAWAFSLHAVQQLSGINVVFFFSSALFPQPFIPAAFAALNCFTTVPAIWAMERAGRRTLLLGSCAAVVAMALLATLMFRLQLLYCSLAAVMLYVVAFAMGLGPVPWMATNELFPTYALPPAASLAVAVNLLTNALVGATFEPLRTLLVDYVFLPYALIVLAFLLVAWFFYPETRGRELKFL